LISRPAFWIFSFCIAIVAVFGYFLLFFQEWQLNAVSVSGNQKIDSKQIESYVTEQYKKNLADFRIFKISSQSFFLLNSNSLTASLENKFPGIASCRVEKKFPKTISIAISERTPVAVFCPNQEDTKCFFLDAGGIAFEETMDTSGLPVLRNIENKEVIIGKQAISLNAMNFFIRTENLLKTGHQINIEEALIVSPLRIHITTGEKWQIYLNLAGELDLQMAKLDALLTSEIPAEKRLQLQYIDLRFKDKAYYK